MGLVALQRLRWGDGYIEPGEPVPEDEAGRDYAGMEHRGEIARSNSAGGDGDPAALDQARQDLAAAERERDDALAKVEALEVERDELAKQVEDLTAPDEAPSEPPAGDASPESPPEALPDGVTELGGGWYQIADGPKVHGRQALTDALAAK